MSLYENLVFVQIKFKQEGSIMKATSDPFLNLFSNMVSQSSGSLLTAAKAGPKEQTIGFLKYTLTLYTYHFKTN